MSDEKEKSSFDALAGLAIDPDVLAKELDAEIVGDPLDDIALDELDADDSKKTEECEAGLKWLQEGHEERLQGLRVFCEYRDPRSLPFLVPLLDEPCPVERMSAVYALGRNPCPAAVDILLKMLHYDSNAYVRRATAWSLGNYSSSPVIEPLVHSLHKDVAAVRLWASSSLAEIGSSSLENADYAAKELILSLQIDVEPGVRSNCIWSLGRLYTHLNQPRKDQMIECIITVLLNDLEPSVRYEARIALEQIENPQVQERFRSLMIDGQLI
ncbi:HEAT repeat domain-containing protein [Prochlorococcus sp. MIT 1223]|uniref:HEAT repeat domain-containing protein n=1 Tax=Prochlorococcus sp. MIT 1223 TaxID=3096217 RepID=UPI002A74F133|nr:HEAT repeat domain-containing protein [Prochlorococcus sp. MIT 1223]